MTKEPRESEKGTKAARKAAVSRAPRAASSAAADRQADTGPEQVRRKPRGRDEVVQSIIDATLSLWTAKGPAELSMRSIAARAGVNYGLVHRHFGTKDAVIRAAMDRVVTRSLDFVSGSEDLEGAVERILPASTGAHARLLAWATLQYVLDDVLPENDVFLARMRELGGQHPASEGQSHRNGDGSAGSADSVATAAAVRVGSLIAMLYGWRLFEPYLRRGLGLGDLQQPELDHYIHQDIMRLLAADPVAGPRPAPASD